MPLVAGGAANVAPALWKCAHGSFRCSRSYPDYCFVDPGDRKRYPITAYPMKLVVQQAQEARDLSHAGLHMSDSIYMMQLSEPLD